MVSIHAPTRGATLAARAYNHRRYVSIHAPTRGATSYPCPILLQDNCFNPRSHAGSDLFPAGGLFHLSRFNPRSHAGSDAHSTTDVFGSGLFQSTLPRGERRQRMSRFPDHIVSIHAPTRGATSAIFNFSRYNAVSIHAPTRGATLRSGFMVSALRFQSTLPRGERPWTLSFSKADWQSFNPRSHAGSDQGHRFPSTRPVSFNPRSHAGSDPRPSMRDKP